MIDKIEHNCFKEPNPFGIRSVVVLNMMKDAQNQYYKNRKKFEQDIDVAIKLLQNAKFDALELFDEANQCEHEEFGSFKVSSRCNLMREYYSHYERTCKKCGFTESYSTYDGINNPDWVNKGLENGVFVSTYYNNNI